MSINSTEFIHGEGAITHDLLHSYGLNSVPVDRKSNLLWAEQDSPATSASTNHNIKKLLQDFNDIENISLQVSFVIVLFI